MRVGRKWRRAERDCGCQWSMKTQVWDPGRVERRHILSIRLSLWHFIRFKELNPRSSIQEMFGVSKRGLTWTQELKITNFNVTPQHVETWGLPKVLLVSPSTLHVFFLLHETFTQQKKPKVIPFNNPLSWPRVAELFHLLNSIFYPKNELTYLLFLPSAAVML